MKLLDERLRVLLKLLSQSWIPALLALMYAIWDYTSAAAAQKGASTFVKSWGVTFFLIMWFVGQWFRAAKQISDSEQLQSIEQKLDALYEGIAGDKPAITEPVIPVQTTTTSNQIDPLKDSPIDRVIAEIPQSSNGALMLVGAELERELRRLMWIAGWKTDRERATVRETIDQLIKYGIVASELGGSVREFLQIRSKLLHGYGVEKKDIIRAIDIGISILQAVLSIPVERRFVEHPSVDIFEDASGISARPEVKGIILKTERPDGTTGTLVLPTSRTGYVKGQQVSSEWNMQKVIGQSWYRNPSSNTVVPAWLSSAEFVGRNMDEIT